MHTIHGRVLPNFFFSIFTWHSAMNSMCTTLIHAVHGRVLPFFFYFFSKHLYKPKITGIYTRKKHGGIYTRKKHTGIYTRKKHAGIYTRKKHAGIYTRKKQSRHLYKRVSSDSVSQKHWYIFLLFTFPLCYG